MEGGSVFDADRINRQKLEFAEEMAIGFYVWAITRAFHLDAAEKLSTKELYQLYIQDKNKNHDT